MQEKEDKQTKFIEWDGKQVSLEEFEKELFDEDDESWKAIYHKNRVEQPKS